MAEEPTADLEKMNHAQDPHRSAASETPPQNDAQGQVASEDAAAPSSDRAPSRKAHPVGFIRQTELVDRVKAYDPDADEDILNRAYVFAMKAHGGQMRQSGDPYFSHPLAVAAILTELRADPATVATAMLHDVVEYTDCSVGDFERMDG